MYFVNIKVGDLTIGVNGTYTEIPSSLIIYPMPYPSATTGPNPNRGFPHLDVERIEVSESAHPGSVNIVGKCVGL